MSYKDFILVLNYVVNRNIYSNIKIKNTFDTLSLNEETMIDGEIVNSKITDMLINLLKILKVEPNYDSILEILNKIRTQDDTKFIYVEKLYNYFHDNNLLDVEVIEQNNGIQYKDFENILLQSFPNGRIENMKMFINLPFEQVKDIFNSISKKLNEQFKRTFIMDIYEASTIEKHYVTKIDLDFLWIDSFKNYKTASIDIQKTIEYTNSFIKP